MKVSIRSCRRRAVIQGQARDDNYGEVAVRGPGRTEVFARLLSHEAAREGFYDPETETMVVEFGSFESAQSAVAELSA